MHKRWISGQHRAAVALPTALLLSLLPVGAGAIPPRVTSGLVAFYPFTEGVGGEVGDQAPASAPESLSATGKLFWLAGSGQNGIDFQGGRVGTPHPQGAPDPNLPLIAALKATGTSTFEAWIDTASLTQHSSNDRILSLGPRFSIRQNDDDLEFRLLHTGKASDGKPWLVTNNGALGAGLTHLVHTFDGSIERLYIDGVAHPTTVADSGTYANWNSAGLLTFGAKADVSYNSLYKTAWLGSIRMVAIYDRALMPAEVLENFTAGPAVPVVSAGPDRATQGLPGQPTQSVTLGGWVPGAPAIALTWSALSGPAGGVVSFDDPSQPVTDAHFSEDGIYELLLTADDGFSLASDRVRVAVNALSSQIAMPQNVFPADDAVGVSTEPTLEVACETGATAARFVIAEDPAFTSIVHDSGESSHYTCSYVAFAGLQGNAVHYWSARIRDAEGWWSDWSAPSQFTTAHAGSITSLLLRQGVDGYIGASDADIRGRVGDPYNPPRLWNQGGQDALRTGRRPVSTLENYRSLLRFELGGIADPDSVINAYLELTGSYHASETDFSFESANSFYEVLVPWGEGTGITEPPDPGEVSWLHSESPTNWAFPGAGGVGSDRAAQPLMRGRFTNQVGHKTFWSSEAFRDAVRVWIADPALNHGFLLQADDEVTLQTLNLGAKEHADVSRRPRLVLELIDRLVLTTAGSDFQAGGSTNLVVEVRDAFGEFVNDDTTQVTFTPSGSAAIIGVVSGTGDGAYGVPGGPEQVTVSAGVASITLKDTKAETFSVSFANNGGLLNPAPDSITVTAGPATQLVLTTPGSDFPVGGSTSLVLEVQDAFGNLVADGTTQVTFTPSGSAAISGVVTGTGDGAYGVAGAPEQVTVNGGIVSVTLVGTQAGSFGLAFSNNAGLLDPPNDVIVAVGIGDSVLVGHGDVSRYDPETGQSEVVLDLGSPSRDVAADMSGNIYTTFEVFVGPGFETDLARNGVVVDTFPGGSGGLAVDFITDTNGDDAPDTSVLVGHGDASGVVSRFDPASGQSDLVLTLSEFVEDVGVNASGDIYTTSEMPNGPSFETRLRKNGLDADLLPGEPGGLASVPLPEPGSVALFAGLSLLFALGRRRTRHAAV